MPPLNIPATVVKHPMAMFREREPTRTAAPPGVPSPGPPSATTPFPADGPPGRRANA